MLNLDTDTLAATVQAAFDRAQGAKRWQTAITKAWGILRDSPFWHMEAGALLILSPDSAELYETDGRRCERIAGERHVNCKAYEQGMPCKHRAAHRLLIRYSEAGH